jgi:hypothetical protein
LPAFLKNPKVLGAIIVAAWVIYVVTENFRMDPIRIRLIPFAADLQLKVSAVIIASAIFGSAVTLAVQALWNRRKSSKPTPSVSQPAGASTSTSA